MPESAFLTSLPRSANGSDLSPMENLALLAKRDPTERDRLLRDLKNNDFTALQWEWQRGWARPSQLPPEDPDWVYWLLLAGRGSGKTRAGAEWIRAAKDTQSPLALIGPTAADVRDVMVRGPAGLLAVAPPDDYPDYQPSQRRVVWRNGAEALLFSAEEPNRLRGPQFMAGWCDEIASWQYPDETWANFTFGLRLGKNPRAVITTTPRPVRIVRELMNDALCRVSRTSSYANRGYLARQFFDKIIQRYEGTRLGRQEIYGELLDDVPGALWSREGIERDRLPFGYRLPDMKRIVVAIDPAMTSGEDADETGIIIAACDWNGHGYVLADVSGHYLPVEWARVALAQYRHHKADRIVAEINAGGEMVENTIRMVDDRVPYTGVHASRGKVIRAEPVSALYEQHRIHHVGSFPKLEDQMVSFTVDFDRSVDDSPDRVDALVWAFSDLLVEPVPPPVRITDAMVRSVSRPVPRRW
jgi:predicted phage terminase large subunit-like protein